MRCRLIIFLCFCVVPSLCAATFTDVSQAAGVHQREVPIDENSGAWMGPGAVAKAGNTQSVRKMWVMK